MLRILLILLPMLLGVWAVRAFLNLPATQKRLWLKRAGWLVAGAILVYLLVSGKLNSVFTLLGVVLAFLARQFPAVLRHAPDLSRLWRILANLLSESHRAGQGGSGPSSNRPPAGAKGMSNNEALAILGLQPGASRDEIIRAHRKLIAKLHPDKGGSDYLAAQINLARKVLLGA